MQAGLKRGSAGKPVQDAAVLLAGRAELAVYLLVGCQEGELTQRIALALATTNCGCAGTPQQREDFTDLYNYLLQNRIIFIGSRINDEVATKVVASMLALEATDSQQDIKMYINSSGGMPYSVISIVDMIDAIKPDVSTIAFGQSASTATLLLAAGKKGKRHSLANARIMMHQPAGGAMGSADEVNITTSELNRTMRVVQSFYSRFTGLPLERVEEETDRDNFLSPQKAMELGVIDSII